MLITKDITAFNRWSQKITGINRWFSIGSCNVGKSQQEINISKEKNKPYQQKREKNKNIRVFAPSI
jgi:hypothetical protein